MSALATMTLDIYLDSLASSDAVPGGGAAVALTGAQAAALLAMAVRISAGDAALVAKLDALRYRLTSLADQDATAFEAVMAAYKLPAADTAGKASRTAKIQAALQGATEPPLAVMGAVGELFDHAEAVVAQVKTTVASDAAIALRLAGAALRAARHNVDINLKYIKDEAFKAHADGLATSALVGRKAQRRELLARVAQCIAG